MDTVSNLGSRIHHFVEMDLKGAPLDDKHIENDLLGPIEAWYNFKDKHDIKLIASEKVVSSRKWRVCGTCDLVVNLDGILYVADFKTGNIYPSAFCQMAAYWSFMCDEPKSKRIAGIENAKLLAIQLPRNGDPVSLHSLSSYYKDQMTMQDELGLFHALRYIWAKRNLKSKKWQPVLKNMEDILSPLNKRFKETFDL